MAEKAKKINGVDAKGSKDLQTEKRHRKTDLKVAGKSAIVADLPTFRNGRFDTWTACLVERDGMKYLSMVLNHSAVQIPLNAQAIAWVRSCLDSLEGRSATQPT